MPPPEKLKKFKHETACIGKDCPLRFSCGLFFNLNERQNVREIIKAPFVITDGQFKGCKSFAKV